MVNQIVDCDVIERGGKQYVKVKNVSSSIESVGFYSFNFESQIAPRFITAMMNQVMDVNWRLFFEEIKPQVNSFVSKIITSLMTPICNGIPLQDFYQSNLAKNPLPK